jgi:hypothetical protein
MKQFSQIDGCIDEKYINFIETIHRIGTTTETNMDQFSQTYDCCVDGKYISFIKTTGIFDLPALFEKCVECDRNIFDHKKVCKKCVCVGRCYHIKVRGTVFCYKDERKKDFYIFTNNRPEYVKTFYLYKRETFYLSKSKSRWKKHNWYIKNGYAILGDGTKYDLLGYDVKRLFCWGVFMMIIKRDYKK